MFWAQEANVSEGDDFLWLVPSAKNLSIIAGKITTYINWRLAWLDTLALGEQ